MFAGVGKGGFWQGMVNGSVDSNARVKEEGRE